MGFRIVKLALALLISWSAAVCAQNGTMSPGDNTTVGDGNTTVGDGNTTIGDGGTTGYLDIGTVAWEKGIGQVDRGNGVFISPNGLLLVVVRKDAVVNAFNPRNGAELWTYTPEDMARASSFGGAFFSTTSTGQDYVMVTVTMDAIFPYQATRYVIGW